MDSHRLINYQYSMDAYIFLGGYRPTQGYTSWKQMDLFFCLFTEIPISRSMIASIAIGWASGKELQMANSWEEDAAHIQGPLEGELTS